MDKAKYLLVMGILCFFTGVSVFGEENVEKKSVWQVSAQNPPAITHDNNPSEPMAFAASELQIYLGRILGAELLILPSSVGGPTIHLSVNHNADLTDEGYELRADGDTYYITGGGDLGLVFGTYEFLRRYGGCQFSDMGPDGEYIPQKQQIKADAGPLLMKPKLWYRGLQFSRGEGKLDHQRIDWMAKNGLNYLIYRPAPEETDPNNLVTIDPQTGEVHIPSKGVPRYTKEWFDQQLRPEVRKRGLKLDMNHHNLCYWLPPGRYFKEHPEWYAEMEGERGKSFSQLCICTSNTEAVNTLIENVLKYLRENPEVKIVGVIPEDGFGLCQCEKCVAGDKNRTDAFQKCQSYRTPEGENCCKTRRYAKLLNTVARAIRDEFPDVLIGGAAYVDIQWPPRDVELEPNTVIWVALYWRDACRPMAPDNTSELNKFFFDILRQWKRVYSGRLIVYEYYMGMHAQCSLPYPMSEVICKDWQHLKRLGVEGATVQCRSYCHRTYALNNLTFARCGWYDNVDYAKVLDDFLLGTYGSVAEEIRPIFEGLLKATRSYAQRNGNLSPNAKNIKYFYNEVGRDTFQNALGAARQKAKTGRERRQVERLSAAVHYWEMVANLFEMRSRAEQLQKSDPKAALAILDQALNEVYPKFQEHMETSMPLGWMTIGDVQKRWNRTFNQMKSAAAKLRN